MPYPQASLLMPHLRSEAVERVDEQLLPVVRHEDHRDRRPATFWRLELCRSTGATARNYIAVSSNLQKDVITLALPSCTPRATGPCKAGTLFTWMLH